MAAQIRQKLEILKKEKDEALEHVDRITSERKEQEERADCVSYCPLQKSTHTHQ